MKTFPQVPVATCRNLSYTGKSSDKDQKMDELLDAEKVKSISERWDRSYWKKHWEAFMAQWCHQAIEDIEHMTRIIEFKDRVIDLMEQGYDKETAMRRVDIEISIAANDGSTSVIN